MRGSLFFAMTAIEKFPTFINLHMDYNESFLILNGLQIYHMASC